MTGTPLAPIGGGLNESLPPHSQPQGTYMLGENVRGVDPRTGRVVWGAQRAGLSALGEPFAGAYARHFTTASKLRSAQEWVSLMPDGVQGASPEAVSAKWSSEIGERALAVARGVDGQAYVLGTSGTVVVLNTAGVEVDRILSATPRGFSTVPRVYVDETGAVYTAATRREQFEGGAGRVYRWTRDEDGVWSQAWESVIPGPVLTFTYRRGVLYVAEDAIETEDAEVLPAALTRIGSPLLGSQIAWREGRVCWPIIDIAITDRGQAVTSSPADPLRGSADAAVFGPRSVDWTPPELAAWSVNAWAWVDAFAVNDAGSVPESDDAVTLMRDRRFEPTEFDPIDDESPERVLRSVRSDLFDAPVFDATAFGGAGGVRFSNFAALVSEIAGSRTEANEQGTLLPGLGEAWTAVMLVQLAAEQADATVPARILSQAQDDGGTSADWHLGTTSAGSTVTLREDGAGGTVGSSAVGTATRTALLSITSDGAGGVELFKDGASVASITGANDEQGGEWNQFDGPFTVLGAGNPNRRNLAAGTTPLFEITELSGALATHRVEFPFLRQVVDGDTGTQFIGIGPGATRYYFNGSADRLCSVDALIFDLGSAVKFDTFAFWSSSFDKSASTVKVQTSNTADFSVIEHEETVDVSRGAGDGNSTRNEFKLGEDTSTAVRYVRFEPLTFYATNFWEVAEVAVYEQEVREGEQAAEFTLGELIVYANDVTSERQFLEGYMAHRWGVQSTLDGAHPYVAAAPGGTGSTSQNEALVVGTLSSPLPVIAKYGTDGTPLAAYTGAGVGLGAVASGERIFAIGDPEPGDEGAVADHGTLVTRFRDNARSFERTLGYADTTRPADRRAPLVLGPRDSLFAGVRQRNGLATVRRFNGDDLTETWSYSTTEVADLAVAGAQIDLVSQGGPWGPEYLFAVQATAEQQVRRLSVLGRKATGTREGRDVTRLAVLSSGDLVRFVDGAWEMVAAAALPGDMPFSATLFGVSYFVDGQGYGAYDHANGTYRDFEEAVKGTLPPRCKLVAAYRSRLILARGDNAFTIYQSAFGEPTNFDTGTEVETISQAVAGTIAAQGNVPEPITALMPFRDDYLFIGTTESLFVLSGDLADGGRLDQVDKSQGVAFGYAWCETPAGIYYFSGRGGVMRVAPGAALEMVSSGAIQRRLEDIDLERNRVRLTYNWIDKTVHVYVIPEDLGSTVQHFVYEERFRAWHVDDFGEGYDSAITAAASMEGDSPDDRTLILGMAGGGVRVWDQYADDDAGEPVRSSVLVGPLVPGGAGAEVRLSGVHGVLDSAQGPIEVAARAGNTADRPGAPGPFRRMEPGRGYGVAANVSAPAVFVEVRGCGRPWAVHELRGELSSQGRARRIS